MICTLKNPLGCVYAYVTWYLVNELGSNNKFGEYIYIEDMWIHEEFREGKTIRKLFKLILESPNSIPAIWVYWFSVKYNRVPKKCYLKARLAKRLEE